MNGSTGRQLNIWHHRAGMFINDFHEVISMNNQSLHCQGIHV